MNTLRAAHYLCASAMHTNSITGLQHPDSESHSRSTGPVIHVPGDKPGQATFAGITQPQPRQTSSSGKRNGAHNAASTCPLPGRQHARTRMLMSGSARTGVNVNKVRVQCPKPQEHAQVPRQSSSLCCSYVLLQRMLLASPSCTTAVSHPACHRSGPTRPTQFETSLKQADLLLSGTWSNTHACRTLVNAYHQLTIAGASPAVHRTRTTVCGRPAVKTQGL